MSLLIVHLLLCLSLHACTGRPLGFIDKGSSGSIELPVKDAGPSIAEKLGETETLRVGGDGKITLASWAAANTELQKNSDALGRRNGDSKGNDIELSSVEVMHKKAAAVKDQLQRRQTRILESLPPENAEESMDPKENGMGEDIVVMDYAQPHRKPPIHNREP